MNVCMCVLGGMCVLYVYERMCMNLLSRQDAERVAAEQLVGLYAGVLTELSAYVCHSMCVCMCQAGADAPATPTVSTVRVVLDVCLCACTVHACWWA